MTATDYIKESLALIRLVLSALFGMVLLSALYIFQSIEMSRIILFFAILSILVLLCFGVYLYFLVDLRNAAED